MVVIDSPRQPVDFTTESVDGRSRGASFRHLLPVIKAGLMDPDEAIDRIGSYRIEAVFCTHLGRDANSGPDMEKSPGYHACR